MHYNMSCGDGGRKGNETQVRPFYYFRDTDANWEAYSKLKSPYSRLNLLQIPYAVLVDGITYFSLSTRIWGPSQMIVINIYQVPL